MFVAQVLELAAVVGDMPAFFNLQAAQGHADAAGPIGQGVGFAPGIAVVLRLGPAQFHDASVPQRGVFPFSAGQVAQHLRAYRVAVALGQRLVGVVPLHFRLPVGFQGLQDLFMAGARQCFLRGHAFLLAFH